MENNHRGFDNNHWQPGGLVANQGGSEITKNMTDKYSWFSPVKILRDRLQDMYTNRVDLVNITGEGMAAAHQSELEEIKWVYYTKSPIAAVATIGVMMGIMFSIFIGFLGSMCIPDGSFVLAAFLFALSFLVIASPFVYIVKIEEITEAAGVWVAGKNTREFHNCMTSALRNVIGGVWLSVAIGYLLAFLLLGFGVGPISGFAVAAFGLHIEHDYLAGIADMASQAAFVWGAVALFAIWAVRTKYMKRVMREVARIQQEHEAAQRQYKYFDAVEEVRALF